jgi:hypothetical protein
MKITFEKKEDGTHRFLDFGIDSEKELFIKIVSYLPNKQSEATYFVNQEELEKVIGALLHLQSTLRKSKPFIKPKF